MHMESHKVEKEVILETAIIFGLRLVSVYAGGQWSCLLSHIEILQ